MVYSKIARENVEISQEILKPSNLSFLSLKEWNMCPVTFSIFLVFMFLGVNCKKCV